MMTTMTADPFALSASEFIDLLPNVYFLCDDIEKRMLIQGYSHSDLMIIHSALSFLNALQSVPYSELWAESGNEPPQSFTFQASNNVCSSLEYEASNVIGKVRVFLNMVFHLISRPVSGWCQANFCCELLENEAFEFEIVAILSFVAHNTSHMDIVSKFIRGYMLHSNHLNNKLLRRIVRNFPCHWMNIWRSLLHENTTTLLSPRSSDPSAFISESLKSRTEDVVRIMLIVNPIYTSMVVEYCISNRCFPRLAIDLILWLHKKREISLFVFLKRLLLDGGSELRTWISTYLKSQLDSQGHLAKMDRHFIEATKSLIPSDPELPLEDEAISGTLVLLRVLAALRGFANYSFPADLCRELLTLLTHKTTISERASQYVIYSLAFLIGLRSTLSMGPQEVSVRGTLMMDTENIIVKWLQSLIDRQNVLQSFIPSDQIGSALQSKPYMEPLLLLAILFHTNQPGPITELISNLLGLRIPSLGRTVNGWRKIFLQSVFTENMIAQQAAKVPITPSLNRRLSTHLPIQCIIQLLKSHAFAKNKLQIKEWVIAQVRESVRPLHPLLPELLEAHIAHSFGTMSTVPLTGTCDTSGTAAESSALITEKELFRQFYRDDKTSVAARLCAPESDSESVSFVTSVRNDSETRATFDLTPELLFLYYALYVYDFQLTSRIAANRHCSPGEAPCVYSERLWECIPITYLLQHARAHLSDYSPLYPRLLQLVTNHLPHLTIGELIIQDELLLDPLWFSEAEDDNTSSRVESISEVFAYSDFISSALPTPDEIDQAFDAVLACVPDRPSVNLFSLDANVYFVTRRLIRLVHQLTSILNSPDLDRLLSYGAVLGRKVPRLLLLCSDSLFFLNRRFVRSLEYLWRRLHLVMPRRLELLTINALQSGISPSTHFAIPAKRLCAADLRSDPVENVMGSVDQSVFRCPSVLRLFLRILESSLLASRSYWGHRLVDRIVLPPGSSTTLGSVANPASPAVIQGLQMSVVNSSRPASPSITTETPFESSASPVPNAVTPNATNLLLSSAPARANNASDEECERLCSTMLLTQNATVVQLLLEHCLPSEQEKSSKSEICVLREIRSIICTYIHYMFIAEPCLADIIVCQTYPRSLIPVSTQAIPSLHICLDNVVNVFRLSGDYAKMVFCLDLVSHLSLHYNIQAALDRAAFMIDSFYHILTAIVCTDERPDLLHACLPAFLRISGAFPSLAPVIARLLLTVGAQIASTLSHESRTALRLSLSASSEETEPPDWTEDTLALSLSERSQLCIKKVMWTFNKLIHRCSAQRFLYYPPEVPAV